MATLYKTDGNVTEVQPKNGTGFGLHELYELLGVEMIEAVSLSDGSILIVDEEGKMNGSPINMQATKVWVKHFGHTDVIVGDALVCNDEEFQ